MNIRITATELTGGRTITDLSMKNRLQQAAIELFAEKGFAGTSVRDICAKADASVPMINHYFGSKQGLLDAILAELSGEKFAVPIRIIEGDLKSREEFITKLELFISETFNVLLGLAPIFRILNREGGEFADLSRVHSALARFLKVAQAKGFVRGTLNPDLTTGLVMDRLGLQIIFAVNPTYKGPNVLQDADFRAEWLSANTEILIHGLAGL